MRFVRATGTYRINDCSRPAGDKTLAVRAGDLVPADHWAVALHREAGARVDYEAAWFVDTSATPRS